MNNFYSNHTANELEQAILDIINAKESTVKSTMFASLLARLEAIEQSILDNSSYSVGHQSWVSSEGQTSFVITDGEYPVGRNALFVNVGGILQPFDAYTEDSSTEFTLSESLPEGINVHAYWFNNFLFDIAGHKAQHAPTGTDSLAIYYQGKYAKNIKEYGAKGDNSTNDYSAFASMLLDIGSASYDIIIPKGIYIIGNNITIPSNVRLIFSNGAIIKRTNSAVITLNCEISAELYQIFDDDGTGSLAGSPRMKQVYPEWFGAKGDGLTDDTNALQKAINLSISLGIMLYSSPNKVYLVTSQVTISGARFVADFSKSTIKANSTINKLIYFDISDKHSNIKNLTLDGNNNCEYTLYCNYAKTNYWDGLKIINSTSYGIYCKDGYEYFFENCYIQGNGLSGGVGIRAYADSHFSNIILLNCHTAIYTTNRSFFNNIHAWLGTGATIQDSKFVNAQGGGFFNQCYPDTYHYAYYRNNASYDLHINNGLLFCNPVIYKTPVMTEVPYLFYFGSPNDSLRVSLSNFEVVPLNASSGISGNGKFSNIDYFLGKISNSNLSTIQKQPIIELNIVNEGFIGDNSTDNYLSLVSLLSKVGSVPTDIYIPFGQFVVSNNLITDPTFTTDTNNNGTIDDWANLTGANVTAVYSIDGGQKTEITASTQADRAGIFKTFSGYTEGDKFVLKLTTKRTTNTGTIKSRIAVYALNNSDVQVGSALIDSNVEYSGYTTLEYTATLPTNATKISVQLRNYAYTTGSTGSVWFKDVYLMKQITIPENVSLNFSEGGRIVLPIQTTEPYLKINGKIVAGMHSIFEGNGSIGGSPRIKEVYPEWFGAKGDGVTDNKTAFKNIFQFVVNTYNLYRGTKLYIPKGTYKIILNDADLIDLQIGSKNMYTLLYIEGINNLTISGGGVISIDNSAVTIKSSFALFKDCDNIKIEGLFFKGNLTWDSTTPIAGDHDNTNLNGISFEHCTNTKFINNTMENILSCISVTGDRKSPAQSALSSYDTVISGNIFKNYGQVSTFGGGTSRFIFSNNLCINSIQCGIKLSSVPLTSDSDSINNSYNILIHDNIFTWEEDFELPVVAWDNTKNFSPVGIMLECHSNKVSIKNNIIDIGRITQQVSNPIQDSASIVLLRGNTDTNYQNNTVDINNNTLIPYSTNNISISIAPFYEDLYIKNNIIKGNVSIGTVNTLTKQYNLLSIENNTFESESTFNILSITNGNYKTINIVENTFNSDVFNNGNVYKNLIELATFTSSVLNIIGNTMNVGDIISYSGSAIIADKVNINNNKLQSFTIYTTNILSYANFSNNVFNASKTIMKLVSGNSNANIVVSGNSGICAGIVNIDTGNLYINNNCLKYSNNEPYNIGTSIIKAGNYTGLAAPSANAGYGVTFIKSDSGDMYIKKSASGTTGWGLINTT